MFEYKKEIKKYLKEKYKTDKKQNIVYSDKIKKEIDILIDNSDELKLEVIYKYKYVIFNKGINISPAIKAKIKPNIIAIAAFAKTSIYTPLPIKNYTTLF